MSNYSPYNPKDSFIANFLKTEAAGGILLILAAILAMILANSPLNPYYEGLINMPVMIKIGAFEINKPWLLWVNDGLMAVFFFLVGLELKREFLEGELSDRKKIIMPAVGAIGGMAVPALVYMYFNMDDPVAMRGWAIPAATDIAFALGVLALLGSRVPSSLKIFLISLAIFDDIGAILIIAVFYTSNLSLTALGIAALCTAGLFILNKKGIVEKSPYFIIGLIMWVALLKSGVHATLAGVVIAMFIPLYGKDKSAISPLKSLEHDLHYTVAFFILPLFAFCNSGINFTNLGMEQITHNVTLGVALGLILGKQIGVFGFCWIGIKLKLIDLPKDFSVLSLYGVSALCGIGFTMSLFIGSLAFAGQTISVDERLGIVVGSLISGVLGYLILNYSLKKVKQV